MIKTGLEPYGQIDDPAWEQFPTAMAWLCNRSWDRISPREPGRLSITPTPQGFTVTLSMYTEGQKGVNRFKRLEELPGALERLCRHEEGEWSELEIGKGAQKLRTERKKLLDARKAGADDDSGKGGEEEGE